MPEPSAHRLEDLIGNTPLVRLCHIERDAPGVQIYGKAEFFNPGGSVKDRPALNMILGRRKVATALRTPGKIILDATSGNTGIAYAMIGAARGYKVRLCLPREMSHRSARKILSAYGAEIVYTPPAEQSDGAIRKVKELYAERPRSCTFIPTNTATRCQLAGPLQNNRAGNLGGRPKARVTHFVAGLGTTGTMMGVGRFLRDSVNHRILS